MTWLKIYKASLNIKDENNYAYANKKCNKYVINLDKFKVSIFVACGNRSVYSNLNFIKI